MIITAAMVHAFEATYERLPTDHDDDGLRIDIRAGLAAVAPLMLADAALDGDEDGWAVGEAVSESFSPHALDTWYRALRLAQGETGGGDLSTADLIDRANDMLIVLLHTPVVPDV